MKAKWKPNSLIESCMHETTDKRIILTTKNVQNFFRTWCVTMPWFHILMISNLLILKVLKGFLRLWIPMYISFHFRYDSLMRTVSLSFNQFQFSNIWNETILQRSIVNYNRQSFDVYEANLSYRSNTKYEFYIVFISQICIR